MNLVYYINIIPIVCITSFLCCNQQWGTTPSPPYHAYCSTMVSYGFHFIYIYIVPFFDKLLIFLPYTNIHIC